MKEIKIRYEKTSDDTGKKKKETETVIVDAITYSEAEEKVRKEYGFLYGDFEILSIKEVKFSEIVNLNGADDKFFKCKISLITIDESSMKERKVTQTLLIRARDFDDASDRLDKVFASSISDIEKVVITDTNIADVL